VWRYHGLFSDTSSSLAGIRRREIWEEASALRFRNDLKEGVYEIFCHFTEGFRKTTWNVRILPFFWDMTCCHEAFGSRLSEGTYRLHLQVPKLWGFTGVPMKLLCPINHWHGVIAREKENSSSPAEKSKKTRIWSRLSLTFKAEAGGTRERIFPYFFSYILLFIKRGREEKYC
jgi:hypothetical protein